MKCKNCDLKYGSKEDRCPFCGTPNPKLSRKRNIGVMTRYNGSDIMSGPVTGREFGYKGSDIMSGSITDAVNTSYTASYKKKVNSSRVFGWFLTGVIWGLIIYLGFKYYDTRGKYDLEWKLHPESVKAVLEQYYEEDHYIELDKALNQYHLKYEFPVYDAYIRFSTSYDYFLFSMIDYIEKAEDLEFTINSEDQKNYQGYYTLEEVKERRDEAVESCIREGASVLTAFHNEEMVQTNPKRYQECVEDIKAFWIGTLGMNIETTEELSQSEYIMLKDVDRATGEILEVIDREQ